MGRTVDRDVIGNFTGTIRCSEDPREQDAWCQRIMSDAEKAGTLFLGVATMPYVLPHAVQVPPAAIAICFPDRPGSQFTATGRGCTCLILQAHPSRGFPPAVEQLLASPAVLKAYAPPSAEPQALRLAAGGRILTGLCDVSTVNLAPLRRRKEMGDIQAILFGILTEIPQSAQGALPATTWARVPLGQAPSKFAASCAFAGLSVLDTIKSVDPNIIHEWQRRQQAQELALLQQQLLLSQQQQQRAPPPAAPAAAPTAPSPPLPPPPPMAAPYDPYSRQPQAADALAAGSGGFGTAAATVPAGVGPRWSSAGAEGAFETAMRQQSGWRGRSPPPAGADWQQQQQHQQLEAPFASDGLPQRHHGGPGFDGAGSGAWDAFVPQQPAGYGAWGGAAPPPQDAGGYSAAAAGGLNYGPGVAAPLALDEVSEILDAYDAAGAGSGAGAGGYAGASHQFQVPAAAYGGGGAPSQPARGLPEIRLPMAAPGGVAGGSGYAPGAGEGPAAAAQPGFGGLAQAPQFAAASGRPARAYDQQQAGWGAGGGGGAGGGFAGEGTYGSGRGSFDAVTTGAGGRGDASQHLAYPADALGGPYNAGGAGAAAGGGYAGAAGLAAGGSAPDYLPGPPSVGAPPAGGAVGAGGRANGAGAVGAFYAGDAGGSPAGSFGVGGGGHARAGDQRPRGRGGSHRQQLQQQQQQHPAPAGGTWGPGNGKPGGSGAGGGAGAGAEGRSGGGQRARGYGSDRGAEPLARGGGVAAAGGAGGRHPQPPGLQARCAAALGRLGPHAGGGGPGERRGGVANGKGAGWAGGHVDGKAGGGPPRRSEQVSARIGGRRGSPPPRGARSPRAGGKRGRSRSATPPRGARPQGRVRSDVDRGSGRRERGVGRSRSRSPRRRRDCREGDRQPRDGGRGEGGGGGGGGSRGGAGARPRSPRGAGADACSGSVGAEAAPGEAGRFRVYVSREGRVCVRFVEPPPTRDPRLGGGDRGREREREWERERQGQRCGGGGGGDDRGRDSRGGGGGGGKRVGLGRDASGEASKRPRRGEESGAAPRDSSSQRGAAQGRTRACERGTRSPERARTPQAGGDDAREGPRRAGTRDTPPGDGAGRAQSGANRLPREAQQEQQQQHQWQQREQQQQEQQQEQRPMDVDAGPAGCTCPPTAVPDHAVSAVSDGTGTVPGGALPGAEPGGLLPGAAPPPPPPPAAVRTAPSAPEWREAGLRCPGAPVTPVLESEGGQAPFGPWAPHAPAESAGPRAAAPGVEGGDALAALAAWAAGGVDLCSDVNEGPACREAPAAGPRESGGEPKGCAQAGRQGGAGQQERPQPSAALGFGAAGTAAYAMGAPAAAAPGAAVAAVVGDAPADEVGSDADVAFERAGTPDFIPLTDQGQCQADCVSRAAAQPSPVAGPKQPVSPLAAAAAPACDVV